MRAKSALQPKYRDWAQKSDFHAIAVKGICPRTKGTNDATGHDKTDSDGDASHDIRGVRRSNDGMLRLNSILRSSDDIGNRTNLVTGISPGPRQFVLVSMF
jgi:hypothetical protein